LTPGRTMDSVWEVLYNDSQRSAALWGHHPMLKLMLSAPGGAFGGGLLTWLIAQRSVPGSVLSTPLVTVYVAGTARSSNSSTRGRQRLTGRRLARTAWVTEP